MSIVFDEVEGRFFGAAASPKITVALTTNLHDFDTLSVRGRHISDGDQVRVEVCHAADRARCDSQIVDAVRR
jgi:hypothetical protein